MIDIVQVLNIDDYIKKWRCIVAVDRAGEVWHVCDTHVLWNPWGGKAHRPSRCAQGGDPWHPCKLQEHRAGLGFEPPVLETQIKKKRHGGYNVAFGQGYVWRF